MKTRFVWPKYSEGKLESIQSARHILFGPDAYKRIHDVIERLELGKKCVIVTGSSKTQKIAGMVADALSNHDIEVIVEGIPPGIPTIHTVKKFSDIIRDYRPRFVIGVGGGRVIDVAKLSAAWNGLKYISMPTSASHDGISSPSVSFLLRKSVVESLGEDWVRCEAPYAIVADTKIIKDAPVETLKAGCGDLISKFISVKDWILAHKLKDEPFSEYAASLAILSARLIALHASEIKPGLEESSRLVVKSLIGSGMAISVAGSSRPASGSEHLFSHALDLLHETKGYPNTSHGIQCGLGAIMMAYLHGWKWKMIRDKLRSIGCPVTAEEAGLMEEAVIEALTIAHKIRKRYTILGDSGLSRSAAEKLALATGVIG